MLSDKNVRRTVLCGLVLIAAVLVRIFMPSGSISAGAFAKELSDGGLAGAITALGKAAIGKADGEDILAALLKDENETETGGETEETDEENKRFFDWRDVPLPAGYSLEEFK